MYDQNSPMYENNTSIYGFLFSDSFLWELALFLFLTGVAMYLVSIGLSKILRVKRRAFLNEPPVNALHHKVDWAFRILGIVCIIVIYAVQPLELGSMYMMLSVVVIGFFCEISRAVIEKKYAENPNEYKFTLIHFPITLIVVALIGYIIFPELTIEMISTFIDWSETNE